MAVTIQTRRDDSTDWSTANPVLALGEIGIETDTDKAKYGDGFTAWNDLPYWIDEGAQIPDGTVQGQTLRYNLTDDGWEATSDLIVTDTGNVGIGTATPFYSLHVVSSDSTVVTVEADTGSLAVTNYRDPFTTTPPQIGSTGNNAVIRTNFIERMRIDSAGNVGIGTSTPDANTRVDIQMSASSQSFGSPAALWLTNTSPTANAKAVLNLRAASNVDTTRERALLVAEGEITSGGNLQFWTRPNAAGIREVGRFDSSGNLLVGKTSATLDGEGVYLQPLGIMNATRDGGTPINANRLTITGAVFQARFNGAAAGQITTDGTNLTFGTGSDIALKDNVQPLENQLEKILALRPVKFEWKASGEMGQGFVAQEVEDIYPDNVVDGESDMAGYKMLLGMDKNYARLVKAIQEQQGQIDELRALIDG